MLVVLMPLQPSQLQSIGVGAKWGGREGGSLGVGAGPHTSSVPSPSQALVGNAPGSITPTPNGAEAWKLRRCEHS